MDSNVDALSSAYQEFVAAAADVLEAKEASAGDKTAAMDAALENLKQKLELLRVACDQAEEFVESIKKRIRSECWVDEATGSVGEKSATTGLRPISAVRFALVIKAVWELLIDLQHGSGTAGAAAHSRPSSAPFDSRFSKDAAQ